MIFGFFHDVFLGDTALARRFVSLRVSRRLGICALSLIVYFSLYGTRKGSDNCPSVKPG